ncbi:MAG: alanine dehydrogenase [Saprospiraceae bacterium]|nr:MAG: alanine dehydrogenase [Bacteroidetes bacterium OLB9]MCO6462877.1 alanine dehydrogenase [Saprospiraceae bacterium]
MSKIKKPIIFSDFFTEGQYETEVEMLAVKENAQRLTIGIPKEILISERRVALTPHSIRTLVGYGHNVVVETGAGQMSNFSDHNYSEAGATVSYSKEEVFKSQVLVKIAPPTSEEIDLMKPDQILISPLQLPVLKDDYLTKLKQKRITALAMEYLQSEDGDYPIVKIMSEIAGSCAILTAAEYLNNTREGGRGLLLGGISGVPPAKIVILGAGVVAESAIKVAMGLGASVRVFDNNISKLSRLQNSIGRHLHTSSINPVYLAYQLTSADVLIGAIHSKSGRTPIIVTEEMVSNMKDGAVIIDVSIDQGGCIETSRMTTLEDPSFIRHGVIHYCVPNITSKVSRSASVAISNIITLLLLKMGTNLNFDNVLYNNQGIRHGCYTYKGFVTNEYLGKRFNEKFTSLDLLLTSKL